MITVRFLKNNNRLVGFEIKGHAGLDEHGKDILCASVSSAAYMTANAVTDVFKASAECFVSQDGEMKLLLLDRDNKSSLDIIKALEFHLRHLAKDYPEHLKVICNTEV